MSLAETFYSPEYKVWEIETSSTSMNENLPETKKMSVPCDSIIGRFYCIKIDRKVMKCEDVDWIHIKGTNDELL